MFARARLHRGRRGAGLGGMLRRSKLGTDVLRTAWDRPAFPLWGFLIGVLVLAFASLPREGFADRALGRCVGGRVSGDGAAPASAGRVAWLAVAYCGSVSGRTSAEVWPWGPRRSLAEDRRPGAGPRIRPHSANVWVSRLMRPFWIRALHPGGGVAFVFYS